MAYSALTKIKVNSPPATLTSNISAADTSIPVDHLEYFHDSAGTLIKRGLKIWNPLSADPLTPEGLTITGASGTTGAGNLTGATRGVKADGTIGAAHAWDSGAKIAVNFTTDLWEQIMGNFEACRSLRDRHVWYPQGANFDLPPSMGGSGAEISYNKLGNGLVQSYLVFTHDTTQYAFFEGVLPADWDTGTVALTSFLRWKSASADTDQVVWRIYGGRFTSGATRDIALSTLLATITQSNGGAEYQNESTETTMNAMGGTGRNFVLMLTRDFGSESPSLEADAHALSLETYFTRALV